MPPRSAVQSLPEAVRADLDQWLIHRGFAGYEELSAWLLEKGFSISKSSLHRYGSAFEAKTEKLRAATQMSKTLAEAVGDDEGAMNDALIRMAQGELFELLLKAEETGESLTELLPEITLSVSRLARASLPQKRWQAEYKAKAASAADSVEKLARSGGLSGETVEAIRREILGVAG